MAVKIDLDQQTISLGVGDLVGQAVQAVGRVAGLSVWARLEMGRDMHTRHQTAQADLHQGYAREMFIRHRTTVDGFTVTIQGRTDGVIPPAGDGPIVVEEIKSVVLAPMMFAALSAESYPHYVEQLRLYCYFITAEQAEKTEAPVAGRLVFVNVPDQAQKQVDLPGPFDECAALIASRVGALIDQAREAADRRQQRREAAAALQFPHPTPRRYQDEMMAAVTAAVEEGRHLLIAAPSGIGKTAGALHPVMRDALAEDRRVFFVTAKNTQHANALATLRAQQTSTAVAFHGREKMCINSVYACREEYCPFLQMFSQKLEQSNIINRLAEKKVVSAADLVAAGEQTRLCPFELALLAAERTDAIVCDYNYVFDPQVYLRRFFQDQDYSDAVLVIDEAHNLVDRALGYYSPVLRRRQVRNVYPHLRQLETKLARAFRRVLQRIEEFFRTMTAHQADEYTQLDDVPPPAATKIQIDAPTSFFEDLKPEINRLAVRYLLDKMTSGRVVPDDPIDAFLADFGHFVTVLGYHGEEFVYVFDTAQGGALQIVCRDASRQLARRMKGFHSVIAMSATLQTMEFHQQMLGLDPARTDQLTLPSPFPRKNRCVRVVDSVLTTYRHRAGNYGKVARIIETTSTARPGHYMALFPSYEFLRRVADELETGSDLLVQTSQMTEHDRANLLAALEQTDAPKLVLAVQGGIFAEGVDYPGELLSGVIVVSPALPQVSYERELMRRYYDQVYSQGFEFAYLYPGMNRVVQSVGRLIRTETDRGVAVLVGRRFAQEQYRSLFPADWTDSPNDLVAKDLRAELAAFWAR